MLSVERCLNARDLADFFALSRTFDYAPQESKYLKCFAHPAVNPLRNNGNMAFLIAREGREVRGRLMTFRDERYIAETGRQRGFFSLFDAEIDAAWALLKRAEELQRSWGSEELLGPVSPNGSGFFQGLCDREAGALLAGHPTPAAGAALEEAGFCVEGAWLSSMISVPENNPLASLAEKVRKRFGLEVESFARPLDRARLSHRISEIAPAGRRADLMREFGHLSSLIDRNFSFAAVKNGVCQGYLLSLSAPRFPLRIATLETALGAFTPAVAAVLLSKICDRCREKGRKTVNVSVIDADNLASWRLTERFNIVENCKFFRYIKKIKMI